MNEHRKRINETYSYMDEKDKEVLARALETGILTLIENKKPSKYYPTLKCIGKYKSKSRIKVAFDNNQLFLLDGRKVNKALLIAARIPKVNVEFDNHTIVLEVT